MEDTKERKKKGEEREREKKLEKTGTFISDFRMLKQKKNKKKLGVCSINQKRQFTFFLLSMLKKFSHFLFSSFFPAAHCFFLSFRKTSHPFLKAYPNPNDEYSADPFGDHHVDVDEYEYDYNDSNNNNHHHHLYNIGTAGPILCKLRQES
jgi:hypothetical protein